MKKLLVILATTILFGAGIASLATAGSNIWSIKGGIIYTGQQTGTIYITLKNLDTGEETPLSKDTPGQYSFRVPDGLYIVKAYRDANGDGKRGIFEPQGQAINQRWFQSATTIVVSGTSIIGQDITLYETQMDSPSGNIIPIDHHI